jgi:TolB-like protein
MAIWTTEINEIGRIHDNFKGQLPGLEKELEQLIRFDDPNVLMLYSRRCLEVIITDLCECELQRRRKTEPMKGIIDKLNKEEKVPSHIITSMHSLNSLSTYGAHPKDFDPEQVKPVMNNLAIVVKWYLKYKGITFPAETAGEEKIDFFNKKEAESDRTRVEKSVAVLPFRNDSPDEENTYFINGLMEEVLNNLQKIKDLRVISRTSVEQYRNQTKPIPEIAKELGVNYIVEGSAQKYGNSFRLRTQLIMAAKEDHLWGESYQQKITEVEDIFNVQSQIAEKIARELKVIITPEEKQLIEKIPTEKLEAYDDYLKGQFYWRKLTSQDLDISLKYFERAKEKDPEFALAYAGIADVWIGRQQLGHTAPEVAGPLAYEAAMKALELDNTRAEVHYTLALMYTWGMFDWQAGEDSFKKAIDLKPAYTEAHIYYSHLLNILARPEEARTHADLALKQDPANPLIIGLYAVDLVFFHEYEKASKLGYEVLKMDPTSGLAAFAIAFANYQLGDFSRSAEGFIKILSIQYPGIIEGLDLSVTKESYKKILELLVEKAIKGRNETYVLSTDIAQIFYLLNKKDLVVEWCEKGFEEHDPNMPYIAQLFESMGDDPRFQQIIRKMNLPYK